jgi:hypothetical protein
MAARLNPRQDNRTRDAIRTTQLCKRLESFAMGEKDPQTGKPLRMTLEQVRAALGLLKKTLPDLVAATLAGPDGGPIAVESPRDRIAGRLARIAASGGTGGDPG